MHKDPSGMRILRQSLGVIAVIGLAVAALLVVKSIIDFSRSGPQVQAEIEAHYQAYGAYALGRLGAWTFLISAFLSAVGVLLYALCSRALSWRFHWFWALIAGGFSFGLLTAVQFLHTLLYLPSSIIVSWNYRNSRLYPIWEQLTPQRLEILQWGLGIAAALLVLFTTLRIARRGGYGFAIGSLLLAAVLVAVPLWAALPARISTAPLQTAAGLDRPNIIMIGSDTLRADRIGALGYSRDTTPFIDRLSQRGALFENFYVPLARTAPSLATLLTGTWPHTHGIRHNYNADDEKTLPVATLPQILEKAGYHTEAVTDWAGGDLGKLGFGFQAFDGPEDQWNLKYLMRQGPKDIRLFLTLFTHNRFGKTFLPELYFYAGVPMGDELTTTAKQAIASLAQGQQPFLLTLFTSNTHIPFQTQYPYYKLFTDPNYAGESKFIMSGLDSPEEIIKKQSQDETAFDVQQVVDLYDGAARSFDALVEDLVSWLDATGLSKDTLIVIFSDHGVDLFEKHTWGQGNSVMGNDPSARVPLLIIDPRRKSATRITHTTRSVDLAPTLLDLLGLTIPASMEGRSLTPYLDDPDTNLNLAAFYETGVWLGPMPGIRSDHLKYPSLLKILEIPNKQTGTMSVKPKYRDIVIRARDRMIRTDDWKLVYLPMKEGAIYWLYDLRNDPENADDVSAQYPEVFARMKERLVQWMKQDRKREWQGEHLVMRPAN